MCEKAFIYDDDCQVSSSFSIKMVSKKVSIANDCVNKKRIWIHILYILYSQFPPNNQIAELSQSYTQAKKQATIFTYCPYLFCKIINQSSILCPHFPSIMKRILKESTTFTLMNMCFKMPFRPMWNHPYSTQDFIFIFSIFVM